MNPRGDLDSLIASGHRHLEEGEPGKALEDWRQAVRLAPRELPPRVLLAAALLRELLLDEAAQEWRTVLDLAGEGEPQARQKLRDLVRDDPRVNRMAAQAYEARARDRFSAGAVADAREDCRRAIALDASLAEAHHLLGVLWGNENRNAEAIPHLQKALEFQPGDLLIYEHLFTCLVGAGRMREADALWHRAVELDPTYESASRLLIRARSSSDYLEQVVKKHVPREGRFAFKAPASDLCTREEFDQVIHHAHHFQARLELERGNLESAVRELQEAVAGDPEDLDAHKGLAQLYAAQGWSEKAAAEWQAALDLSPGDADARQALKGPRGCLWPFR